MVGINVGWKVFGKEEVILSCFDVYIGVLIDDFVIKGINELYCFLILCVEYRLFFCYDNVDLCLIEIGYCIGLIFDEWYVVFEKKKVVIEVEKKCLYFVIIKLFLEN